MEYADEIGSPYGQYVLSLGLEKLLRVAIADTYEERLGLLNSGRGPSVTPDFLHRALEMVNERDDGIYLSDFTSVYELPHVKAPYFADTDSGPLDVWRWAHLDETRAQFVYRVDRQILREWGYVMWDRSRLDEIGIFQKDWVPTDDVQNSLLDASETESGRVWMETSFRMRQEIYRAGGRGWWSVGDHSRIEWPNGKPFPPPKPRLGPVYRRIEANSLEEAREALSTMKLPSLATIRRKSQIG